MCWLGWSWINGRSSRRDQLQAYNWPGVFIDDLIVWYQDGRVVKALDLRSNGHVSAWVRTPLLVVIFSFLISLISARFLQYFHIFRSGWCNFIDIWFIFHFWYIGLNFRPRAIWYMRGSHYLCLKFLHGYLTGRVLWRTCVYQAISVLLCHQQLAICREPRLHTSWPRYTWLVMHQFQYHQPHLYSDNPGLQLKQNIQTKTTTARGENSYNIAVRYRPVGAADSAVGTSPSLL